MQPLSKLQPHNEPSAVTDADTQERDLQQGLSDHGPGADAVSSKACDQYSESPLLDWLDARIAESAEPGASFGKTPQQLHNDAQRLDEEPETFSFLDIAAAVAAWEACSS